MTQAEDSGTDNGIPVAAKVYGFAGLVPFIGAAVAIWIQDPFWTGNGLSFLYGYSLFMLTFIGAIHWGRALAGDFPKALNFAKLGWSIMPAVIGPTILFQPYKAAIPVLMACLFAYTFYVDVRAVRAGFFPPWYGRLRKYLTIGVLVVMFMVFLELGRILPIN